jgi:hypothetical protein
MIRGELNRNGKSILKDFDPSENRGFPDNQNSSRGTHRGEEAEIIKRSGTKLPDKRQIKGASLGFLNTDYVIVTLHNLVSEGVPFAFCINASDIPTEDFPDPDSIKIIHRKNKTKRALVVLCIA